MLAQRRLLWPNIITQLGQCICYLGGGLSGDGRRKSHPHGNYGNAVPQSMDTECWVVVGHLQTRWINIEAILVNRPVVAVDAGVEVWSAGSVLK